MLERIRAFFRWLFLAIIGAAIFGSVWFGPEIANLGKNYSFPHVRIDATVHQDGSMSVVERRTFDFRRSFSFAFFTLQHRLAGDVTDFSIRDEAGVYWPVEAIGFDRTSHYMEIEDGPSEFKATWHFDISDEVRTFEIRYTRRCAVELLGDRAYLNWKAIGETWEKVTRRADVTVHLPGRPALPQLGNARPAEPCRPGNEPGAGGRTQTAPLEPGEVQVFSHGPLQGGHGLAGPNTATGFVTDLQPLQFYEMGVLFPAEAVPFLGPPAAPVVGPDAPDTVTSADEVLAIERRLAAEANAQRARNDLLDVLWQVAGWSLVPFLVAMVIWSFRRDRVPDVPRTLQEPPEQIHPAELALLWSAYRGHFAPKDAYRAQLLHLATQGVIDVVADGRVSDPKDLQVRRVREPADPLDARFVSFLFDAQPGGVGSPVRLADVKARGTRTARLGGWWRYGVRRLKQPLERIKGGQTRRESVLAFLWAAGVGASGFWAYAHLHKRPPLILIPAALVGWAIATRIIPPRLDDALRRRLVQWRAFRRFLTEFSNLRDAPALAVIIWEHYLVYATALGVADRVAKQVRALVPEGALPSPWPGAPPGSTGYHWANSFSSRAPAQAAVSTSGVVSNQITWSGSWGSSSSGGGGGGGSSGGGGGGGGGSGGGAG
ncbi:MAG: DUF2207 domain-containing protein [Actinomycetota bacterium]